MDDERLVFLREHEGRLQAHVLTVATREVVRITDAPHLVMDVHPVGTEEVVFLNRDGLNFTIDRAPLVPIAPTEADAGTARVEMAGHAVLEQAPHPSAPSPEAEPGAPRIPDVRTDTPASESEQAPTAEPSESEFAAFPMPGAPLQPHAEQPPSSSGSEPGIGAPPSEQIPTSPAEGAVPSPPGLPSEQPASEDTAPPSPSPAAEDAPTALTALTGLDGPVEAPPEPGTELQILSDEPYSPLERLFIPELRVPYLLAGADPDNTDDTYSMGGLALAGKDRLGFHAYSLLLSFDTREDAPSLSLAYGNAQLAPWYIQVSGAYIRQNQRTDLQATAFASRSFWTTPVTFGVLALRREYDAADRFPRMLTRIVGPEVSVSYFAGDATSYGSTQRGLGMTAVAGVYPGAFLRDSTMGDVRLGLDAFTGAFPSRGATTSASPRWGASSPARRPGCSRSAA